MAYTLYANIIRARKIKLKTLKAFIQQSFKYYL